MLPSHSLDTVDNLDYWILSVDAGMKYKGIFLQTEFYTRRLYDFELNPNSTGPLPVT